MDFNEVQKSLTNKTLKGDHIDFSKDNITHILSELELKLITETYSRVITNSQIVIELPYEEFSQNIKIYAPTNNITIQIIEESTPDYTNRYLKCHKKLIEATKNNKN